MGGRGSGPFTRRSPEELARLVRNAEDAVTDSVFQSDLATMLSDLLGSANGRDVNLVRERLDDLTQGLADSIEGSIDQVFGGSVAKHTYVDGLSDIDSLLILSNAELEAGGPKAALAFMCDVVRRHLGASAHVSHGQMAVTVRYPDGMEVQLLPAVKSAEGNLQVPSSRRDGWSRIDPAGFQAALTRRNQECGQKLVPTIKLAKSINGSLPKSQQLSGYHMESLAVAAFRDYSGTKSPDAMLPVFFERARELVLRPIRDRTGQSVHVDEYLGPPNSDDRLARSHILGRIAKRIRNATVGRSMAQWRALLGLDE